MKSKNGAKSKFGNIFYKKNRFKCREIAEQKKIACPSKGYCSWRSQLLAGRELLSRYYGNECLNISRSPSCLVQISFFMLPLYIVDLSSKVEVVFSEK